MVTIKACIEALKATWMRRLLTMDSKWQVFIKYYIQTENITGCGIKYLQEKNDKFTYYILERCFTIRNKY